MTDHDDLRDWDAAYLLGSLSTDDRRRYERHLADCPACSASMAELAGLPGLLARVPMAEAEATLEQAPTAAPDLLPKLAGHIARRRRRLRRWMLAVAVGGVAAALAVGIVVAPGLVDSVTTPPTAAVQLQPVGQSPLEASIRLVEEQWGTRIEMECRYDAVDAYSAPADYAMYVTDAAGDDVRVATWTAAPGQTATPSGSTSLTLAQIRTVEVRSVVDGTVLLRGSP
ncbi:MAG TPA: zf-HC2 domain-containing protein [Homoserinimonas sp.]|nr:zf-HC2 domain-containing protein [Homoserinimonas sp.]